MSSGIRRRQRPAKEVLKQSRCDLADIHKMPSPVVPNTVPLLVPDLHSERQKADGQSHEMTVFREKRRELIPFPPLKEAVSWLVTSTYPFFFMKSDQKIG